MSPLAISFTIYVKHFLHQIYFNVYGNSSNSHISAQNVKHFTNLSSNGLMEFHSINFVFLSSQYFFFEISLLTWIVCLIPCCCPLTETGMNFAEGAEDRVA